MSLRKIWINLLDVGKFDASHYIHSIRGDQSNSGNLK